MLKQYKFDGSEKLNIKKIPTNAVEDKVEREEIEAKFSENLLKMEELQEKLYADGREGVIVVIQALDAAGKDSTIKHVMTGFNPQGVYVESFKVPSEEEAAHDFLWRIHRHVPERGDIVIFNRSHYEEVLTVQINDIHKGYRLAERVKNDSDQEFFKKRYRQIRDFEEYLYENSYRIVKIYLNVSKAEQKERFLERIERQEKNWKFNAGDLDVRDQFDTYLETYEKVINETATKHSPWYVIPADQKWYTRYLVSEIMLDLLKEIDPQFPEVSKEQIEAMEESKKRLLEEK